MSKRTPSDLFGAYVEYMKVMFSNLFLLNGGAAVALLAFLGDSGVDSADSFVDSADARRAIICFALGAAAAIVATAMAALLENWNADRLEKDENFATTLGYISIVFIGISICLFVYACAAAIGVI